MKWFASRLVTLIHVLHSPESAFRENLSGPTYLVPFLVLGFSFIVISFLQVPFNLQWMEYQMSASGASADQITSSLELVRKSSRLGVLLVPLLLISKWSFFALVLWLTSQLILREIQYQKVLTVVAYSYSALLLRDAFIYLIVTLRGSEALQRADGLNVAIGLNLIFPAIPMPWAVFAGNINLFEAWYVLLLAIGLSRLAGTTWQRGVAVVLPNWVFITLVQVGMVSLGLAFQGSVSNPR